MNITDEYVEKTARDLIETEVALQQIVGLLRASGVDSQYYEHLRQGTVCIRAAELLRKLKEERPS